jgi:hypothetical protein
VIEAIDLKFQYVSNGLKIRAYFVPEIEPDKQCIDDQTALSRNETNGQGNTSWRPERISNISQRRSITVVDHGMGSTFWTKPLNLQFLYLLQDVHESCLIPWQLLTWIHRYLPGKISTCTSY